MAPEVKKMPMVTPITMTAMEPVPSSRFGFVYLGSWSSGSVGVEAEGLLIKADVGVGRLEEDSMLSQLSLTATRFLAVVGLLF